MPSLKMLVVAYGTGTKARTENFLESVLIPEFRNFLTVQKFLRDYEVLVSDHQEYLHWRKASSGLPLRPVTGGCDSKGQESRNTETKVSSFTTLSDRYGSRIPERL